MKSFARVLRLALRLRFTVVAVCICSLVVGVMWGANISVVYPIVEIVFQGQSVNDWISHQIAQADEGSQELSHQIADLRRRKAEAGPDVQHRLQRQVEVLENRLAAEQKLLTRARKLQPHVQRHLPNDAFGSLIFVVGFLIVSAAIRGFALASSSLLVARLAHRTTMRLRRCCYAKLLEMDLRMIHEQSSGELLSRFTHEVDKTVAGLKLLFGRYLREPVKMIVCLVGAGFVSWRLLLISLVIGPIGVGLTTMLSRSIRRANRRLISETAGLYSLLSESLRSMTVIKAFTMESAKRRSFDEASDQLYRKSMRVEFYDSLVTPNNELMGTGVIAMGVLAGGHLVLNQQTQLFGIHVLDRPLSVGTLMAFFAFLAGASDPLRRLSGCFSRMQGCFAAADRVYEILDREPTVTDPTAPLPLNSGRHDLAFENVSFEYVPGQPVLKEIDLRVRQGETLAIVGPNGCGKTTLVNLILRFYDPQQGTVRLGDTDLRQVRQKDLRSRIGLVRQQSLLFDDTVMNNIRFGRPDANDDEVVKAAELAHAHAFIVEHLSDGYDTPVGELGGRLSGGQRQRIELARAILRDPDLLIMDEATSQIDAESEQLIHSALHRFAQDRTAIMITHRMSTLFIADRIVVLEAGRIVATGSHDDLSRDCELYQRFCQSATEQKAA